MSSPPPAPDVAFAAPGRIEGVRQESALSAGLDGVVRDVLVDEGDGVRAGQIVAHLDCVDIESELHGAEAAERAAIASRLRLLRGGRADARAEAEAHVRAAEARLANASLTLERAIGLFTGDQVVPRAAVDEAERNEKVARAELEEARQHAGVARADPLPEEQSAADAAVAASRAHRAAAVARLGKCVVRRPIDGIVLRRHLEPGERIAAGLDRPILSIADTSSLRVRVEVDERDVGAVRVGQTVLVRSDALGARSIRGVASRVSPEMGRKHVRTGDPAEKADRDVLEVEAWIPISLSSLAPATPLFLLNNIEENVGGEETYTPPSSP